MIIKRFAGKWLDCNNKARSCELDSGSAIWLIAAKWAQTVGRCWMQGAGTGARLPVDWLNLALSGPFVAKKVNKFLCRSTWLPPSKEANEDADGWSYKLQASSLEHPTKPIQTQPSPTQCLSSPTCIPHFGRAPSQLRFLSSWVHLVAFPSVPRVSAVDNSQIHTLKTHRWTNADTGEHQ